MHTVLLSTNKKCYISDHLPFVFTFYTASQFFGNRVVGQHIDNLHYAGDTNIDMQAQLNTNSKATD